MGEERQRIDIPDLNFVSALNFCDYLSTLPSDGKYDFYFPSNASYDPFPMLIVSSSIRRFIARNTNLKENLKIYNKSKNSYAAHMGFYKACGWQVGNAVGEAPGSSTYIPITKKAIKELEEECKVNRTVIQEEIEKLAKKMAAILSRKNIDLQEALTFLLREIIRNTPEHGRTEEVWYCAQYWPSISLVELAIMDEGCGLYESLKSNKSLDDCINNDEDALEYAMKPGISRVINRNRKKRTYEDELENSGYGLFMASQICIRLNGSFTIVSGSKAMHLRFNRMTGKCESEIYDTDFKGTAIAMRFKTNKIAKYQKVITEALQEGEKLAKDDTNAIKTASKSSMGVRNRTTK